MTVKPPPSDADIAALPKIELHLHLDCSLDFEAAQALGIAYDRPVFDQVFRAPQRCATLAEFLGRVPRSLELLQSEKALRITATNLADRLAAENVVYAEIRFAPQLHLEQGLTMEQVVECVLEAFDDAAQRLDVGFGVILCSLRHQDTAMGMKLAALAHRYRDRGVVGFDLAGDEAGYGLEAHAPVFARARDLGLNLTAHAGEARGASSVRRTIEKLAPRRIGHGVRAIEDPAVVDLLLESDIHLEICPTCNIQIGVFRSMEEHSIDRLTKLGVSTSVNTDARTLCPTDLGREYRAMRDVFGWTLDDLRAANRRAAERSFLPGDLKVEVLSRLDAPLRLEAKVA